MDASLAGRRPLTHRRSSRPYWMSEEPIRPVRACVTYRALADIDPEQVRDLDGALTTFDTNRDRIDMAANSKFDAGEVESDLHEGQPLILLTTDDL
jgi:hypothetical protein